MALIKNQTLVEFTGRIGKTVYKQRGSVKYMSALPRKYPPPQDPNSVYNRNQLFLISKLAGLINAVDLLKMIWKKEYPNCYSPFHEISIANYHLYKYLDLRGTLALTPRTGFPVFNPSFEIERGKLNLSATPLSPETGIDISTEKFITSATLFLMNSNISSQPGPCFNARKGDKISLDFEHSLQIITHLSGEAVLYSLPDTLVKLWSVLITLDENNNPVRYSDLITWPPDIRHFLNDDTPNDYMNLLSFPNRNSPGNRWSA
jgi:hypothetical protein